MDDRYRAALRSFKGKAPDDSIKAMLREAVDEENRVSQELSGMIDEARRAREAAEAMLGEVTLAMESFKSDIQKTTADMISAVQNAVRESASQIAPPHVPQPVDFSGVMRAVSDLSSRVDGLSKAVPKTTTPHDYVVSDMRRDGAGNLMQFTLKPQ